MMPHSRSAFVLLLSLSALRGQAPTAPVINPRGVINAFTQQPAPSSVGRGGILQIEGWNLGPPEGATAPGPPMPTQLAGVQVLLGGVPIPLFSVNPGTIIAQVPVDADVGLSEIVVRRASGTSRPARFFVNAMEPSVRTKDGSGYGQIWGTKSGASLTLSATGLGPTNPPLDSGSAGDGTEGPSAPLTAYVGGLRVNATATASAKRVGEFDVQIDVPSAAGPGDLVGLFAGNRAANMTVFQPLAAPVVQFLAFPDGTPEVRDLAGAGMNGNYLIASGPRDDAGCYPAIILDFARQSASPIGSCLTTGNRNAPTPLVAPNDGDAIGALVGPPQGELPAGVSSRVQIFTAATDTPLTVDLPSTATALAAAGADFIAVLAGSPPQAVTIDSQTGEIREGGGAAIGGGGGAGLGAALGALTNLNVGGLTHPLSAPVAMGQGRLALVVGDDANKPTRAKFAVVNPNGEAALSKDFPDGWLPLLAPPAPRPGGGAGAGAAPAAPARESVFFDGVTRVFYALSRTPDNSSNGLLAFTLDRADPKVLAFPDGWFAAACTPNIQIFNLELSRAAAVIGSKVAETEVKTPCIGAGFLELDLTSQVISAVPLESQALINAAGAADVNDYLYAVANDGARAALSDTIHVLDATTGSTFSLTMPSGVRGFAALTPIPALSLLVGSATSRRQGDAGLVIFDLDQQTVRLVPVPADYESIAYVGTFLATRKLVVRGIQPDNAGTQLLIYDLKSDELIPASASGVAFVGPPPPQPGAGAAPAMRLLTTNPRANTVAAVAYNAEGKQVGVVILRVP